MGSIHTSYQSLDRIQVLDLSLYRIYIRNIYIYIVIHLHIYIYILIFVKYGWG